MVNSDGFCSLQSLPINKDLKVRTALDSSVRIGFMLWGRPEMTSCRRAGGGVPLSMTRHDKGRRGGACGT